MFCGFWELVCLRVVCLVVFGLSDWFAWHMFVGLFICFVVLMVVWFDCVV